VGVKIYQKIGATAQGKRYIVATTLNAATTLSLKNIHTTHVISKCAKKGIGLVIILTSDNIFLHAAARIKSIISAASLGKNESAKEMCPKGAIS